MQNYIQQFNNQESDKYFCYLHLKILANAIIGFAQFVAWLLILIYATKQYKKFSEINLTNRNIKLIFASIVLQCLLFIGRVIFSQVVFWQYYINPPLDVEQQHAQLTPISKKVFLLDVVNVFVVQATLILVCYNWMDKTIQILEKILQIQEQFQHQESLKITRHLKFQMICKKILLFFLIARFFVYGFILGFLIQKEGRPQGQSFHAIIVFMLIQAFFIPVTLMIGLYAIKKNKRINYIVNQQQTQTMANQYIILILCTLIRFGFGFFITFEQFFQILNAGCKIYQEVSSKDLGIDIAFYGGEIIFCYIVPVLIVLRIYRVEKKSVEISSSLIGHQNVLAQERNSINYK